MISVEYATERVGRAVRVVPRHQAAGPGAVGRLVEVGGREGDEVLRIESIPATGILTEFRLVDVAELWVRG